MTAETVAIQVPEAIYRRLERLAALSGQPLESLVMQTLSSTLPPLPDDLPPLARDALVELEQHSDAELQVLMRATFPTAQYDQFVELRTKQRTSTLTTDERVMLDSLQQEIDLHPLRKAYAAVLLKWRGHRLPSLASLEATP